MAVADVEAGVAGKGEEMTGGSQRARSAATACRMNAEHGRVANNNNRQRRFNQKSDDEIIPPTLL